MDLKYNDVVIIKNEVITSGTLTCKENLLQTLYQDFYFSKYYEYDKTKVLSLQQQQAIHTYSLWNG